MILGLKKKTPKSLDQISLRDFHAKRNKILVYRDARGIGDILNCRMLFKNFKKLMPDLHLTFGCFEEYIGLVKGHPYVDEVISIDKMNKSDYMASYDISSCCIHYESREMSKNQKHRAEIWAEHCGIKLLDHDMHLPFLNQEQLLHGTISLMNARGMTQESNNKNGKSVFFCPTAYEKMRSLTPELTIETIKLLRNKGLFIYSANDGPVDLLSKMSVPVLIGKTLNEWMSFIHAADYVVTVDTSNFHYAGAIKKPLMGIFTHVDGKLRGMFYDFVLVQKHRDNCDWPCGGPCYNYLYCSHPKCEEPVVGPNNQRHPLGLRPCVTELTIDDIKDGLDKMLLRWPI